MVKNVIITTLSYIVFSLMVQKPENVDLIVKDVATAKNMVVEGTDYVKKTFTKEFSAHENKAEEIIEELNGKIEEETWFNEK